MKAEKKNIVCTDRHKLENIIPLSTPFTLAIDPCNLCNFKCDFCAIQSKNDILPFKKQIMDIDLFKKIINDICAFKEKLKVLRINGQGEPLLNAKLPDMIAYAKTKNVADYVEIITNGSKLSPELNTELIASGVDRIRISIEALDSEGYEKVTGKKIDFTKLLENIDDLHNKSGKCEIYCKIVNTSVPLQEDKDRFYSLFEDKCDRMFVDNVIPLWSDFDELNEQLVYKQGIHGQRIQNVQVCPYPFYSLIINSDGQVTVCCADWKRKLIVGDLKTQSMQEIWNGKILHKFWIDMLNKKKSDYEMCQKCLLPMFDCNDNIDLYAEQLAKKLKEKYINE